MLGVVHTVSVAFIVAERKKTNGCQLTLTAVFAIYFMTLTIMSILISVPDVCACACLCG